MENYNNSNLKCDFIYENGEKNGRGKDYFLKSHPNPPPQILDLPNFWGGNFGDKIEH